MIVYFIPLVPVIIGIFLIASALVGELTEILSVIHTILFIIILIGFILLFINILRNASAGPRRNIAAVLSVVSCAVSLVGLDQLISMLSTVENSLFVLFEFGIPAVIGGFVLFFIVFGSMMLCLRIADL